jgi:endonuclease/exonuclease/phosphatase family metal-dependent hydrolase
LFGTGSWNTRRDGELFIASRYPIAAARPIKLNEPPAEQWKARLGAAAYYRLITPIGPVSLINVHLSSPHAALDALRAFDPTVPQQLDYNTRCRMSESATIQSFANNLGEPVVILGDFNTPRESAVYKQYWNTFTNAFTSDGFGFGSTHVSAKSSVRIDHILLTPGWAARDCFLGQAAGSPHKPLVADLEQSDETGSFASTSDR